MKKILQINVTVNTGSTGRFTEEIANTAMEAGYESYIAYGRTNNGSRSHLIRIGNWMNVVIHGLYSRLFDKHGLASKLATKKFIQQIEQLKPDVVHIHNLHGYYINYEILMTYLNRIQIPIVWTLYDCWAMTGHCSYFDMVGCTKWQTACHSCSSTKAYPKSIFLDNSRSNYDTKKRVFSSCDNLTIVTNSVWLANIVSDSFLKDKKKVVINTGLDLNIFQPTPSSRILQEYGIPENKFIVLGVANIWNRRKGLDDFLQLSQLMDDSFIIVLVGLKKAKMKNLPKNIIGISRTENINALAQLYSVAGAYVNPTWADNYPTTNLEALACGTPVITYNTGGSPEVVSEDTGFVIEKGDIQGIKQAIETIKTFGVVYYSAKCRQRALELYNKKERYNEYVKLYDSLFV